MLRAKERYQSVSELKSIFAPPPIPPIPPPTPNYRKLVVATGSALVAMLAVGCFLGLSQNCDASYACSGGSSNSRTTSASQCGT